MLPLHRLAPSAADYFDGFRAAIITLIDNTMPGRLNQSYATRLAQDRPFSD